MTLRGTPPLPGGRPAPGEVLSTQIRLAERPVGIPRDEDWEVTREPVPAPAEGEVLVEVVYISIAPAMRTWLHDRESYVPPIAIGELMRGQGIGRILESRHPRRRVGELVIGQFGVQTHATVSGQGLTPVDTELAPAPTWLGLLGNTGLTAYFGLFDVARPRPGETVLVSGAAGAVGSAVGQLAKLQGCEVVGVAGGPEKCAWLTEELGFSQAIDYKNEDVASALGSALPGGVDMFFDNVGGEILELALSRLNLGARIVVFGSISDYNAVERPPGPRNYIELVIRRATMAGMLVSDYEARFDEARRDLSGLMREDRIVAREHVVEGGVERFPEALRMLFTGANFGKLVLAV